MDTNNDQSSVPGRKLDSSSDSDTIPSVLSLTVSDIKHHNIGCTEVESVVFMPSGHVVLACHKDGLKLLDEHFKQLSQLSIFSLRACKVSDTEVLVSQGDMKQIQYVEVLPKMVPKKILNIGRVLAGICYHKEEIYVVCRVTWCDGEVRVLNKDGRVLRRLGSHDWKFMFTQPNDVQVNTTGDKVFVTDCVTHSLTCVDQTGMIIYQYTDTDLKLPTGILVDKHDNVLVTAAGSDNIHVIDKEGRKHKIVQTKKGVLYMPWCISYRHDEDLLAIEMYSRDMTKSLVTVKTT